MREAFIMAPGDAPDYVTDRGALWNSVEDMEKAVEFYYGPLNMTLFIESVLEGPETNRALCLPEDCRTRSVIVQGDHEYGKIALAVPMNYEVPNLVPDAVPSMKYIWPACGVPTTRSKLTVSPVASGTEGLSDHR